VQGLWNQKGVVASATALGLMVLSPVHATLPAPPPPCPGSFDSEPIVQLVEQVKQASGPDWNAGWTAGCAADSMSRKDARVIPTLLTLLDTHDRTVESLALRAVCGTGHSGATAVPYIERRLRAGGLSFAIGAYPVLVCVGEGAIPAIPLLIEKSEGVNVSFAAESDRAIETLGQLSSRAPERIIPHLIHLLDERDHAAAAAKALERIGKPARTAQNSLRRNLSAAVQARQDEIADALISALGRVGDTRPTVAILISLLDQPGEADAAAVALGKIGPAAKAAVPALINRFNLPNIDVRERADVVSALIAIDAHSVPVLKVVLDELNHADGGIGDYMAAAAVASVKPFPLELAPALVSAIEQRDADDSIRQQLEQVLAHTDPTLKPVMRSRPVPQDVSPRLADGLWALTVQSSPIKPEDLVKQLRIRLDDFVQEGNSISHSWRRRSGRLGSSNNMDPINSIELGGVWHSPGAGLPDSQTLDITLDNHSCMSSDGIRARIGSPEQSIPDPNVVVVSSKLGSPDPGTLRFEGDRSADKSKARASSISLGVACSRRIRVAKSFDSGYWNYVCPFAYDQTFATNVIVPALQKQFGPKPGQFAFDTPEIMDMGWQVQLKYTEVTPNPTPADWLASRLQLLVDRCSRGISNMSKYIP